MRLHWVMASSRNKVFSLKIMYLYIISICKFVLPSILHQALSGLLWDDYNQMMKSVYFIKAKVENGLALQLLEDLQLNLSSNSTVTSSTAWKFKKKEFLADPDICDITTFVTNNLDVLAK